MHKYGEVIGQWLAEAGVRINGPDLWDIRVRDDRFYARVLKDGSLGLGEAYMAGWWDCPRIDEFICRLLKGNLEDKIRGNLRTLLFYLSARIFNRQKAWTGLSGRYDRIFKRMWEYYLLSCAGALRARHIQVWQIVMTKPGTIQQPQRFA